MPARFARSGSISQLHGEALLAPVVAHAHRPRDAEENAPSPASARFRKRPRCRPAPRRDQCRTASDQDPHRLLTGCLQLPHVDPRARNARSQRTLQRPDQVRRIVLVVHLDDDLRVVQLLQLRRQPRTRSAARLRRRRWSANPEPPAACRLFPDVSCPYCSRLVADHCFRVARRLAGHGHAVRPPAATHPRWPRYGRSFGKNWLFRRAREIRPPTRTTSETASTSQPMLDRASRRRGSRSPRSRACAAPRSALRGLPLGRSR